MSNMFLRCSRIFPVRIFPPVSIGSGKRWEKKRISSLLLPADAVIVFRMIAWSWYDADQIKDHFLAQVRLQGFRDFILLFGDDDHLGFVENVVDFRTHERRDMGNLVFDVGFIGTKNLGQGNLGIIDLDPASFPQQRFRKHDSGAMAQIISAGLEAQPEDSYF